MDRDDMAADTRDVDRAGMQRRMQPGTEGVQMQEAVKERKKDRRSGVSSHFTSPVNDRRRPANERRVGQTLDLAPGAIRPGVGEAVPVRERRRVPGSGME